MSEHWADFITLLVCPILDKEVNYITYMYSFFTFKHLFSIVLIPGNESQIDTYKVSEAYVGLVGM